MKAVWRVAAALALALAAALPVQAHAHLLRAVPADGSTISVAPPQLRLVFAAAVTLTALSIEKAGDPAPLPLAPLPRQAAAEFAIALPPLVAGGYLVKWRALSDDQHLATGALRFSLLRG